MERKRKEDWNKETHSFIQLVKFFSVASCVCEKERKSSETDSSLQIS